MKNVKKKWKDLSKKTGTCRKYKTKNMKITKKIDRMKIKKRNSTQKVQ